MNHYRRISTSILHCVGKSDSGLLGTNKMIFVVGNMKSNGLILGGCTSIAFMPLSVVEPGSILKIAFGTYEFMVQDLAVIVLKVNTTTAPPLVEVFPPMMGGLVNKAFYVMGKILKQDENHHMLIVNRDLELYNHKIHVGNEARKPSYLHGSLPCVIPDLRRPSSFELEENGEDVFSSVVSTLKKRFDLTYNRNTLVLEDPTILVKRGLFPVEETLVAGIVIGRLVASTSEDELVEKMVANDVKGKNAGNTEEVSCPL